VRDDQGIDAETGDGLAHRVESGAVRGFGSSGRVRHYSNGCRPDAFAARMAARNASSAGSAASSG
jgi:hypothetical protein